MSCSSGPICALTSRMALRRALTSTGFVRCRLKLHRLYSLSFWDALIVHAARRAGCDRLMTEDLQSGQRIEGVEIVNPFA
jgi:predicted nucleic acid-binding protein